MRSVKCLGYSAPSMRNHLASSRLLRSSLPRPTVCRQWGLSLLCARAGGASPDWHPHWSPLPMGRPRGQGLPLAKALVLRVWPHYRGRRNCRIPPPGSFSQASSSPMPTEHLPSNTHPNRGELGLLTPLPFFSFLFLPSHVPRPFLPRPYSCRPLQPGRQDMEAEGWAWVVFGPFRGSERGVSVRKTVQSAHTAASGPPPHRWRHPPAANVRLAEVMTYTCPWLRRDACLLSAGPMLAVPAFLPHKIKLFS